jgi:hypothetical protein
MAPNHHPTPLSGGDRKALNKELGKARAMANILALRSAEMRAKGKAMIQADKLLCESWNERMWSDGEPTDPSRQWRLSMARDPVRPVSRPASGGDPATTGLAAAPSPTGRLTCASTR